VGHVGNVPIGLELQKIKIKKFLALGCEKKICL
jgi:hypothetical protein